MQNCGFSCIFAAGFLRLAADFVGKVCICALRQIWLSVIVHNAISSLLHDIQRYTVMQSESLRTDGRKNICKILMTS